MKFTKKKILFLLESRATYGYAKNVIEVINDFKNLNYATLVTGGHLSKTNDTSLKYIRKDNIKIDEKIKFEILNKKFSWSFYIGKAISKFSLALEKIKPDIALIFGDRVETLSFCITCAYMNIPIAHVQAGDKSGHIDDSARYAIAKLAHIHFASCEDSVQRLLKLGEQKFRIFNTGAPQLDNIMRDSKINNKEDLNFFKKQKFILFIFHPIMAELKNLELYVDNIFQACFTTKLNIVVIFPNTDLGSEKIIKVINKFKKSIKIYKNLEREKFLYLLKNCEFLIGNSSAGILEAPSFKKPTINVGNRQRGRPQSENIINSGYSKYSIINAIKVLKSRKFQSSLAKVKNIYGDGRSGVRICKILDKIDINKKWTDKETTY